MKRLARAVRAFFRELTRDLDEYPEVDGVTATLPHLKMDEDVLRYVLSGAYLDKTGGRCLNDRVGRFGNPTISYREAHGHNCPECGGRGMAHMGNPPCPTCDS